MRKVGDFGDPSLSLEVLRLIGVENSGGFAAVETDVVLLWEAPETLLGPPSKRSGTLRPVSCYDSSFYMRAFFRKPWLPNLCLTKALGLGYLC